MSGPSRLPRSVYVHVPFCSRRCSYCDFAVHAVSEPPTSAWLAAVTAELRLLADRARWPLPLQIETLYIGGGTPSLLDPTAMADLARRTSAYLEWDPATVEWTCEANPESFTPVIADAWRRAGVNRLSLGVQTFHEPSLRWMGRLHGPEGGPRAVRTAREAGFADLSVDLIFGLPERLGRVWSDDLSRALDLGPDHVSLYGLTAEAGAPLGRWVAEGRERLADEDRYADEFLLAHEMLTGAGFRHYEVSNFARDDRLSRHNQTYWAGDAYIGLGPGAHAFDPPVRRWNTRSWDAYLDAVERGRLPIDGEEVIGPQEERLEAIWLSLRTDRGYDLAAASPAELRSAEEWTRLGLAEKGGAVLRLTPEGWLLLDRLAVELAHAAPAAAAAEPTGRSDRPSG